MPENDPRKVKYPITREEPARVIVTEYSIADVESTIANIEREIEAKTENLAEAKARLAYQKALLKDVEAQAI